MAFLPPYPSEDYHFNPFFQPYELVDDVSTEERRGYALDMLRYMRISGFDLVSSGNKISSLTEVSAHTCIYVYIRIYMYVFDVSILLYVLIRYVTTFSTSPGKAVRIRRSFHCNSLTNFSNSCLRVSIKFLHYIMLECIHYTYIHGICTCTLHDYVHL